MSTELLQMKCVPCRGGEPTLTGAEILGLRPEVPAWSVLEREGIERLERTFSFKNFSEALSFTNKVGGNRGGRWASPSTVDGVGQGHRYVVDSQDKRSAQE